jgi:hypothetical protein
MRLLLLATLLGAGCGNNAPDIPPELLGAGGGGSATYPPGPYPANAEEGDAVKPLCFPQGWRNPEEAGHDTEQLAEICFADFHDPDGSKGISILMLNTAAFWCAACKEEHTRLDELYDELHPAGLEILSVLFERTDRTPAGPEDLRQWTSTFGTNFPIVVDPSYQMGHFIDAGIAPLNLLVDARTMSVAKRYEGDARTEIEAFLRERLGAR